MQQGAECSLLEDTFGWSDAARSIERREPPPLFPRGTISDIRAARSSRAQTYERERGQLTVSSRRVSAHRKNEVDVIGYTSNQSDTDDHSSVQSSSDSGVAMSTSRLTLSEMMDNL
ncbi:uncharacterized protein LOC144467748 [Augochlora pura]